MGEIKITRDVLFGTVIDYKGNIQNLGYDVYEPAEADSSRRPVMIFVHGGGFTYGNDKTQKYIVMYCEHFAKKGYVCFSVDYRLRAKADIEGKYFPPETVWDAVDDLQIAVSYIQNSADHYNIYTDYILAGGSAGGITSAYFCSAKQYGKLPKNRTGLKAHINLWGSPDPAFAKLEADDQFPPTIMIHGTEDALVSYQHAVAFEAFLTEHQIRHELITIEGAGHTPVPHSEMFLERIEGFLKG